MSDDAAKNPARQACQELGPNFSGVTDDYHKQQPAGSSDNRKEGRLGVRATHVADSEDADAGKLTFSR